MSLFLTDEDLAEFTGRKIKSKQIQALRFMGHPFFVNAVGKPMVTVASIEGRIEPPKAKQWEYQSHGTQAK